MLKAPAVNPELKNAASRLVIKKDSYQINLQSQLGIGLSALANAITKILENEKIANGTDEEITSIIGAMTDGMNILIDLHHEMSLTRRALIIPSLKQIVHKRKMPQLAHYFLETISQKK